MSELPSSEDLDTYPSTDAPQQVTPCFVKSPYDGLVVLAAAQNDLVLLTRDARALATYARLGVRTEVLD